MINYVLTFLKSLMRDEKGQAMVEYGLIIVLVAIAVFAALTLMGDQVNALFNNITQKLTPVE